MNEATDFRPAVTRAEHGALPQALVDAFIGTYVDWGEEAQAVQEAYRRWAGAGRSRRALAFGAYRAALDREEAGAAAHARVVELVGSAR